MQSCFIVLQGTFSYSHQYKTTFPVHIHLMSIDSDSESELPVRRTRTNYHSTFYPVQDPEKDTNWKRVKRAYAKDKQS
jgi:hypothetical protein